MSRSPSEYEENSEKEEEKKTIIVSNEETKTAHKHLYLKMLSCWEMWAGIIPSLIDGAGNIVIFLIFGRILNLLSRWASYPHNPPGMPGSDIYRPYKDICQEVIYLVIVAVVLGVGKFFELFAWVRLGSKMSISIRKDLYKSMMQSDVTFFDEHSIGSVLTLLSEDAALVQQAFGPTKGQQISIIAKMILSLVLCYVYNWKMALIMTASFPIFGLIYWCILSKIAQITGAQFGFTSQAITIAQESLSSIRTVRGFNNEENEIVRFKDTSMKSADCEKKKGILNSVMMGSVMVVIWGMLIGNTYYGTTLINNDFQIGDLMAFFLFGMFGCMSIFEIQATIQSEQAATAAGARILKMTAFTPALNFEGGLEPSNLIGEIEFKNVSFKYPTRNAFVLKDVSFVAKPGEVTALVGHSGSGKSTCVQLIERFYDVTSGIITIDGRDIKEYNPRWLHRQIGLVNQEPTLFSASILDNVRYGAPEATVEEVEAVTEIVNAKKFIDKISDGMQTMVGEKGASLSGGQRQRIAIARAVIKDPKILITDEATSALDASSERKVQEALDKVMVGRTSIVVAHRLSTIKNASKIFVFDMGEIVEEGVHNDLVAKGGVYYNLVARQLTQAEADLGKK